MVVKTPEKGCLAVYWGANGLAMCQQKLWQRPFWDVSAVWNVCSTLWNSCSRPWKRFGTPFCRYGSMLLLDELV